MEKCQLLAELIDRAVSNGWEPHTVAYKTRGMVFGDHPSRITNVMTSHLLFGDNLSFLKALFGKSRTTLPLHNPDWLNVAIGLVQNHDDDRIPSLYSQVFGGQDD